MIVALQGFSLAPSAHPPHTLAKVLGSLLTLTTLLHLPFGLIPFLHEFLWGNGFKALVSIRVTWLLLLTHFSRVRFCAAPKTAAHQAPPSLGFSRQEHWSGLSFPSPIHESESEVTRSRLTLRDPAGCSLPGSSVHGIFQARVSEWGATESSGHLITSVYRGHLEKH